MSDPVDDLIDSQLILGPQKPAYRIDTCPICKFEWHGLPKAGCPGGFNGE